MSIRNNKELATVDFFTQTPVIHPEGAIEVRPAHPGEIGYQLGARAVVAVSRTELKHDNPIGATNRKVYPSILGQPDVYADRRDPSQ